MTPSTGDTSISAPKQGSRTKPGSRNVLITSALPYVNDVPHLGNIIGSCLSADVYARFCRARGLNTLFIGGTDEYGTATEIAAAREGRTPEELCDRYRPIHADIYQWFNISFDKFGRTTTQTQTQIAQQIFSRLHENGHLEERISCRLYCESHGFLADRYVVGDCPKCGKGARGDECDACGPFEDAIELKNPRCNQNGCGAIPVERHTKHLFFRLNRLQSRVEIFVDEFKRFWSSNGISQTLPWFKNGLKERCITRDIKFGTPIPPHLLHLFGCEGKAIYNWFDAPIGYISITAEHTEYWRDWWQPQDPNDVQLVQFLGKDNIFFHSIFFPATLIATEDNWTKVHSLCATEYLQYEGTKFSKSKRIGVFGDQAKASGIKADIWRFYLLYNRPEQNDTEFKWDAFIEANNSQLSKNLGNFVNRVIKFVNNPNPKGYDRIVPDGSQLHDSDGRVEHCKTEVNDLLCSYLRHLDAVELRAALKDAFSICRAGNLLATQAFDIDKSDKEERGAYFTVCLNIICLLASILQPFLPDTAESIARQLGVEPESVLSIPDTFDCDVIRKGHQLGEAEPLFTRIDPKRAEDWKVQYGGGRSTGGASG